MVEPTVHELMTHTARLRDAHQAHRDHRAGLAAEAVEKVAQRRTEGREDTTE